MKIIANLLLRKALFLFALFFLSTLFSCKKDGKLTPDFDSGNLVVNFIDTFSIKTSLIQEDSLRTDLSVVHLLGIYNDPIFGPRSSSIYTNVGLSGFQTDFGSTVTIDSVVLSLDYVGVYGDSNSSMLVNVFELTSPLDASTDYYSNTYTPFQSTLLGSATFTPNFKDSILTLVDSVLHKPHLRIKLTDPTLISELITNSPYSDNTALNNVLSGLYIVTNDTATFPSPILPETGGIAYFDMNSALSKVTVYYNNSVTDSLQESFVFNNEIVKYNRFIHDYTATDIEAHMNNLPGKNDNVSYVQTMAGVKTKIELPNIKDLAKDGSVTINKAELIFTIENGTEGIFDDALPSLSLTGIDANGDAVFLPDVFEGEEHYGGSLDQTTKTYTFNISRHIYQLVYNTPIDYGMYLVANKSTTTANRSVISSENSLNFKIKLEITYSKL